MSANRLRNRKFASIGFFLALATCFPIASLAAPGTLAQAPLFLSTSTVPNIFFVLDDSGSMDSEILKNTGAETAHPLQFVFSPSFALLYRSDGNLTAPPQGDDQMLELCPGYNVLAYDPSIAYTPWSGKDDAGNAYTDRTLSTACDNPSSGPCNVDISGWVYFLWTDDGDGEYDVGECPRLCASDPVTGCGTVDAAACAGITGCVTATDASTDATNFANWYSYYRKREYVQKKAVSAVIANSSQRMGLATLHNTPATPHNGLQGASTPVRDMSDTVSASVCGAGTSHKDCLLSRLFSLDSGLGGATPLRRALDEAGAYFDETDSLNHEYLGAAEGSPILPANEGGNCQQNFAIVVSDGFWNGTWPDTDNAGQTLASHGDADSDNDTLWDGGTQADGGDGTQTCGPFAAPAMTADTLADVAMHYYESDLSSLANDVPTLIGVDENDQQHLVTFTVAFGVDGTLSDDPPNRTDAGFFNYWPPVCMDSATSVDDMRHTAWNSRGKFLSAKNPVSVSNALESAIATIVAHGATTAAAVGFSTSRLSTNTLLFQSQLETVLWSGDLEAFQLNAAGAPISPPVWSAASMLDAPALSTANRIVLTNGAADGVTFEWSNLTAAQKQDLCITAAACTPTEEALGRLRLDFLRGERSCEAPGGCPSGVDIDGDGTNDDLVLRERGSRLGDIVGSAPAVVGPPEMNWPSAGTGFFPTQSSEVTYAEFKADPTYAGRTPVVYVGANDGMLHGFRVSDGRELIAYVPAELASNAASEGLHFLTDSGYNGSHRYYVDRTPSISDVYIPSSDGGSDPAWRTVAVGGLGAGGQALYALDITNPATFNPATFTAADAASTVMWEFDSSDDPELGYTMGQPVIAMMNNGKWAAVVGSGYNDSGTNLNAHLFIVFLEEGLDGTWDVPTGAATDEYVKIEAPIPGLTERNGLSSPAVADLDGDGAADRVYAGDLMGNVWAFDVSSTAQTSWGVASGETTAGVAAADTPLFQSASDMIDPTQPITMKPEISKHPTVDDIVGGVDDNQPNVTVYFGTGQFLTDADKSTANRHYFFGVWDRGFVGLDRSNLQEQTVDASLEVVSDEAVTWALSDGSGEFGWYLTLPVLGERVVVDAALRGGIVFFNSLVPASVGSVSPCSNGGSGFLYAVDMVNGGRPDSPTFDVNGDAVVDLNDLVTDSTGTSQVASRTAFAGIPTASTFISDKQYTGGGRPPRALAPLQGSDTGRLSWEQLYLD